ncbi:MAG: ABC transporter ATP-binding protein [Verrucomicrobiota bacterium]|nr:ABC transporter ATP-binding protein [Verrucomicrobiota bacterium]
MNNERYNTDKKLILKASDISKSYNSDKNRIKVVDNYNIDLFSSEFVSLTGPSGCGKTTILMIIGCLLKPDHGTVEIDGLDIYSMNSSRIAEQRSKKIGFIYQDFKLIPYLTIKENILCSSLINDVGNLEDKANDLILRLGLIHRVNHRPEQLSAGEKQRTAIARALLMEPKLIIADEPTGNLDKKNSSLVIEALKHYSDEGACVIMVSHDEDVKKSSDRHIQMDPI